MIVMVVVVVGGGVLKAKSVIDPCVVVLRLWRLCLCISRALCISNKRLLPFDHSYFHYTTQCVGCVCVSWHPNNEKWHIQSKVYSIWALFPIFFFIFPIAFWSLVNFVYWWFSNSWLMFIVLLNRYTFSLFVRTDWLHPQRIHLARFLFLDSNQYYRLVLLWNWLIGWGIGRCVSVKIMFGFDLFVC